MINKAVGQLLILFTLCTLSLGAQTTGGNTNRVTVPRLAGIVDLASLSVLWKDTGDQRPAGPEPIDIATITEGPVILFADRFLSLGRDLEMTQRTVQDLAGGSELPQGLIPSRLLFNPLSEPLIYDAESGSLLLVRRDGSGTVRFETGMSRAREAADLRRGGIALSDDKRIVILTRSGSGLSSREISLPVAYSTGLDLDEQNRLWIYDLAARKIRVFSLDGEELFSITPDISGGSLLFPQVFQTHPDGGFFLGTSGQLWCFNPDGSLRWRLSQFNAGYRQALPAFYRLAVGSTRSGDQTTVSFYLLDPPGQRILKFIEQHPGGAVADEGVRGGVDSEAEAGSQEIAATLAAAFQDGKSLHSRQNEIVRFCLEKELFLQAAFFRRSSNGEALVTDLGERLRSKQAGLLAQLAGRLENQLRYSEAEEAYNRSLSLYRELRNLDPVNPRYPEAIRDLSKQRNTVRQILFAEETLSARLEGEGQSLDILLANTSGRTVEQVELLVRFYGYPDSRWQGSFNRIPPGGKARAAIRFTGAGNEENNEDLHLSCNLLVRFMQNGQRAAQYFRFPVIFPVGTLRLPESW